MVSLNRSRVADRVDARCSGGIEGDRAEPSDVTLMVAIARGTGGALAEVYRRHADHMYGLAVGLCGHGRAQDVVQEVFLELWQKPERFVGDRGSLRTFLLTQTYGRSVDRLRSDGARETRQVAHARRTTFPEPDVETTVLGHLDRDAVWRHLRALPDEQRDAIVLAFFEGHTYREVARLLGQPEGTVKSRIRAGLARLHLQLSGEGSTSRSF